MKAIIHVIRPRSTSVRHLYHLHLDRCRASVTERLRSGGMVSCRHWDGFTPQTPLDLRSCLVEFIRLEVLLVMEQAALKPD